LSVRHKTATKQLNYLMLDFWIKFSDVHKADVDIADLLKRPDCFMIVDRRYKELKYPMIQ